MPVFKRNKRILSVFICFATVFVLCFSSLGFAPARAEGASSLDVMDTVSFAEDNSPIANPERGWYRAYETDDMWDISQVRSQGISVVLLKADLKNYKTGPIGDAKLQEIRNAFNTARKYGLQVMFRAAYDFDGVLKPEPTSLSIITGHISQLKAIFYENEDILYCVQAGFLGPWGEWHNSYYGDPPSLSARKTVLFALMDAVPKTRSILVRRPMFIRDIYGSEPGGSTLTLSSAFSQSNLARTGYHDDALLSSSSECGTYVESGYNRQAELNWVNNQDRYVPFAAESNQLSTYSDPQNAVTELSMLHAQIVDAVYHPDVISKWKATSYGSTTTYNYITQRLGYRLVLLNAAVNSEVRQGGALHLQIRLRNDGFGNLINERKLCVVLSNGQSSFTAAVSDDPRRWFRESGEIVRDFYFSIPSSIEQGSYSVYLSLPSNSPTLAANPLYSVRFANTNTWMADKGYNLLMSGIRIGSTTAANTVDSFRQISRDAAEALCLPVESATAEPTATLSPTPEATSQPEATSAPASTTEPAATPSSEPEVTATPEPTATATPDSTIAPAPTATATPDSTTVPAPTGTPAPPSITSSIVTNVKAVPVNYNSIKITWSVMNGVTRYEVYRSGSSTGPFTLLSATSAASYINGSVQTGTKYYYKVRAVQLIDSGSQYSRFSAVVSAKTSLSGPKPVSAERMSSSSIRIKWNSVSGATKYEVWRSSSLSGPYQLIVTTGSSYHANSGLRPGRYYYYKVRAYRLINGNKVYGAFSNVVYKRT